MSSVTNLIRQVQSIRRERAGSTSLMFTGCIGLFAACAAATVDLSNIHRSRAEMQSALDAAVLAAAASTTDKWKSEAEETFFSSFDNIARPSVTLSIAKDGAGVVTGSAKGPLPLYFGPLINVPAKPIEALAQAKTPPASAVVCMLLTEPTASDAFKIQTDSAVVHMPNCEIHVLSTNNAAAWLDGTKIKAKFLKIAGKKSGNKTPSTSDVTIKQNCTSTNNCVLASEPSGLPVQSYSCAGQTGKTFNTGTHPTLSPGTFCNDWNFNSNNNVTLLPGVYIIAGKWNVNSGVTLTGNGVTLYFATSSSFVQFNAGSKATLTAPINKAGVPGVPGVVIYEPKNLSPTQITLNSDIRLQGLVYLPSRRVTYNSGSSTTTSATHAAGCTSTVTDTAQAPVCATLIYRSVLVNAGAQVEINLDTASALGTGAGGTAKTAYLSR